MKFLIWISAVFLLTACSAPQKSAKEERAEDREKIQAQLSQEMSLKSDRSDLAELRKDIPDEKKKENDELALFLQLMNQSKESPTEMRDRFNSLVQKKRSAYREKVQRLREDYRHDETKRREDYLDAQKKRRDDFNRHKHDSRANREYYSDEDKKRQRFFADERDRRQSFESELNSQSKDFDNYMRERQKEFDEQYRLYSKKLSERPKDKKAVTGEGGEDFKTLKDVPATPLGTDE